MLVVIAILLLLSTLAFAVFGTGKSSDRMRSGARSAQSALLGAKDRAMHAKDLRGVRLTLDQSNFNLVNGFVYVQSLGTLTYPQGSFQLERLDANPEDSTPDTPDVLIVRGFDGSESGNPALPFVDWAQKSEFFTTPGRIKIPAGPAGLWFTFSTNAGSRYTLQQGNQCLLLATSFPQSVNSTGFVVANDRSTGFSSCEIQLGNDVLPFHQPISLPSGCVIDLYRSQIPPTWYQQQSVLPNSVPQGYIVVGNDPNTSGNVIVRQYLSQMDIMFSPRGNVTGSVSALGAIFFCIRDMRDATRQLDPANLNFTNTALIPQGDTLILAVYPQTGLVQTFEADLTDNRNNSTGNAGADQIADDIFTFAKLGMAAGR